MENTEQRVALVTGGAQGIGRAIALALAGAGAAVAVVDLNPEGVAGAVAELEATGRRAFGFVGDVSSLSFAQEAVEKTVAAAGALHVLVNNAGITRDQLLMRMKREDWDRVLEVNLSGAFVCTQAVLRPMMKQRSGRIISISSVVGQMGNAGQSNYAASKAGLIGFSKSLAREVAARSITVNVVAPGLIDTDMTRALPPDVQAEWQSKVPLSRFGTPEDVAAAVCFLASDEASYITGQVLAVNGGMYT
jgi:3-oxoacyl-[acyl-carrier protein] reductase